LGLLTLIRMGKIPGFDVICSSCCILCGFFWFLLVWLLRWHCTSSHDLSWLYTTYSLPFWLVVIFVFGWILAYRDMFPSIRHLHSLISFYFLWILYSLLDYISLVIAICSPIHLLVIISCCPIESNFIISHQHKLDWRTWRSINVSLWISATDSGETDPVSHPFPRFFFSSFFVYVLRMAWFQ
jgi:hypothetical protein